MKITYTKNKQLNELRVLLKQACHTPKCNKISTCPRQCGCRTERTFELNTDTAICWEIADLLWPLQRCDTVNKAYVKEIKDKIMAYAEVSRHHSTKGWDRFFWSVEETYNAIMNLDGISLDCEPENRLADLKNRIGRLKRYPRVL